MILIYNYDFSIRDVCVFFKSRRNIAKYRKIVNVTGFISNMLIFRLKMIRNANVMAIKISIVRKQHILRVYPLYFSTWTCNTF